MTKTNHAFEKALKQLNPDQTKAVETIYGPVLVIAGPGTGKTQLLGARVANILKKTDVSASNILCLTFTENGAKNMRDRLKRFIGAEAYDVNISTYHAFGGSILRRFPEYFLNLRLERPVDELGKHEILEKIIDRVDYGSPIKQARYHLKDLAATISETKRGLISPEELRQIGQDNRQVIADTSSEINKLLEPYAARMPSKLDVALPLWQTVLEALQVRPTKPIGEVQPLTVLAAEELETALEEAEEAKSTKTLTAWKNRWLEKDANNHFRLAGDLASRRIQALAGVVEAYDQELAKSGQYDFDDMILRSIHLLENNDDLRFSLQEQHQFILLDEFQDTNASQLRLVELLTNNPVHEGRPNVLAVGDDDQAIYAFQGALYSNMLDFASMYKGVEIISLTENYRSTAPILSLAANVSKQIEARLVSSLPGITKDIKSNAEDQTTAIDRRHYDSDVSERAGVAEQIKQLIDSGVAASDIAVLAPKHKYLEPLVPFLQKLDVPVAYEKREDILESARIRQLLTMMRLVKAVSDQNFSLADSLWPEVLSYDFWEFSVTDIWQIALKTRSERKSWPELLLESPAFRHAILLVLTLAGRAKIDPAEAIIDALVGTTAVQTGDKKLPSVRSPFRDFYLSANDSSMLDMISELKVLGANLSDRQLSAGQTFYLDDFVKLVQMYQSAEVQMTNTSPYRQSLDAVELMSVYKAKGLEWKHVFLISCHDDVWGSKSSSASNYLTLPSNLSHIRHAGTTEDEKLRLFFVALTRARQGLYLTSFESTFAGKKTESCKYFDESETETGQLISRNIPEPFNLRRDGQAALAPVEAVLTDWQARHLQAPAAELRAMLSDRLTTYKLSPTHLTSFLDLKYAGPESFLLNTLLGFPGADSEDASFGNAIHQTLEWVQLELNKNGTLSNADAVTEHAAALIDRSSLTDEQRAKQKKRAKQALEVFMAQHQFKPDDIPEKSFPGQAIQLGPVALGGKIDLLELDEDNKTITVVDFKTGAAETKWRGDSIKLHKYALQLYCYKILIEASGAYKGWSIDSGKLVFVEPDHDGNIIHLNLPFNDKRLGEVKKLLEAMWQSVQALELPDTSNYGDTVSAVKQFEKDLIAKVSQ